jgi:hypothetical protein
MRHMVILWYLVMLLALLVFTVFEDAYKPLKDGETLVEPSSD